MRSLGIDIGSSTVAIVLLEDGRIRERWIGRHHEKLLETLIEGLRELGAETAADVVGVTGSGAGALKGALPRALFVDEIPAVVAGARKLVPQAGSIIDIGSQGARFITDLAGKAPRFAVNEHCAGGTGSFFEDQMSRLGMKIEDYSAEVEKAASVPRLSGRCAVFAKTDIIHRQQEGIPTPDILLGLCYAMIRNYKAVIVRELPVTPPVVFCGGVTRNRGVARAIREVFGLAEDGLVIPEDAVCAAAAGAALEAQSGAGSGTADCDDTDNADRRETAGDRGTTVQSLIGALEGARLQTKRESLPALELLPGTSLAEPAATHRIPEGGVSLGIDVGSTSTDLVLLGADGSLVDFQYLRTEGNPERAVRRGLDAIRSRYGEIPFHAVGVTGSGRERIGRLLGADAVRDEITAQARAAAAWCPDADTVFEIGGQDSKYISLKDGAVRDFQMNKICAAGTGSFVEEQAARMGIPIGEFGSLALRARNPARLGERCTVFIETAIAAAGAEGVPQEDIAAGLCHSIVRNYLTKVVGGKPAGGRIVLQGGVAYNPGIVAAFQKEFGERITVSPCFSISGAYGAALLAGESMRDGAVSGFRGYDFGGDNGGRQAVSEEIAGNKAFYHRAEALLLDGYDGKRDPAKKTVGVPFCLMIHKFFPMANAFFKALGFNVLLTAPTDEETIRLSQQLARGETCYPVKLIYGHMQQLIDAGVDYIFLPSIHTMKHEKSRVAHNYGCVYMQTAPRSIAEALHLRERGIELLNPVFDLDFGQKAMAGAMAGLGKQLHRAAPLCAKALLNGAAAVRRHTEAVEREGRRLLAEIRPDEKVLVLITRNYGIGDPVLNMGIPDLLLDRGCRVITLSHLPAHDLDISGDYPNLYWPFGQHIISGAKLIAANPNLFAVYLTNHGCGPDSMLSQLFRAEMGGKPYLQIEVDEHFSKVGVVTRVEAFLNSLEGWTRGNAAKAAAGVDLDDKAAVGGDSSEAAARGAISERDILISQLPDRSLPMRVPDFGCYTAFLVPALQEMGFDARALPAFSAEMLAMGRGVTNSKEYLPFPALLGQVMADRKRLEAAQTGRTEAAQYLIPQTRGAEADGVYARAICAALQSDSPPASAVHLEAPMLETLPALPEFDLICRALAAGDLLYAAPPQVRGGFLAELGPDVSGGRGTRMLPSWTRLEEMAEQIGKYPANGRKIGAVGTPLMLTVLDDRVLETLETEGELLLRAPLLEALWMLWRDQDEAAAWKSKLAALKGQLGRLHARLGERSAFAAEPEGLLRTADRVLPGFAGGFGRYRYAKAVEMGTHTAAVLHLAPRYENTAMVLDMRGLGGACEAPLFTLALDADWDAGAWTRLRSFLHYCT